MESRSFYIEIYDQSTRKPHGGRYFESFEQLVSAASRIRQKGPDIVIHVGDRRRHLTVEQRDELKKLAPLEFI